ncbi:MAG: T9SS type A sorting domain-containing protein [bacterium]
MRLSYSGAAWSIDSGFPVTLSGFNFAGGRGCVLTKARNGELWVFRYESSQLQGKRSSNDGLTWSATFTIKNSLASSGVFDAVTFTSGGQNYAGVGYAENSSSTSKFGFLRHKDGDPDGSWTDETNAMPQFNEAYSDDQMAMTVSQNNEIYFVVKTDPNTSTAAGLGLLKRNADGNWQNFVVQGGTSWVRPAVVVDETNNELYVFGTQESSPDHGQYKKCALGNESSLLNAAVVEIFDDGTFDNISVPAHRVTGATALLVCAENTTAEEIWYNLLPISGGGGTSPTPLVVNNVTVNPNTSAQTASYTIPFTLGSNGALTGGSGTITVTWPSGTTIPAAIANSAVTVNGANASNVTSNSATRQATVTVPGSLATNAFVSVIFTNAAGIINPASAGNYTLTVATSVEASPVTSSPYAIQSAGPMSLGAITLSINEANAMSSYTVPLTLGSSGALAAGSGTITLQFPDNTAVPSGIAANQISVNGTTVSNATSNTNTRQVTITTPVTLGNNANVSVALSAGANLLNPSTAGNYTLQAWTSAQPTPVTSPAYAIAAATTNISAANVTLSPNTPNNPAAYTIAFNLGAHGRLLPGASTITLTFNNSTGVANGSLTGVQVNGVNATATGNSAGKTIIITVPAVLALNNNAAVTINLPASAITNPASAGDYTLTVATSVESTPETSDDYAIISESSPPATGIDNPIAGTTGGYDKPHQNRSFYHAGTWWTTARRSSDGAWYLWKLSDSTWSAQVNLGIKSSDRPDCHVDSPANKLYILMASTSSAGSKVFRLSYSNGAWSISSGFPVALSSFTFSGESGAVFAKAKNGDLWAFRYYSGKLEGRRSSNDGLTWSSTFAVKSSLGNSGLLDAVAFTSGGENYVGVCYGENTSSSGKFGFLRHKDGDPDGSWTDETGSIPQLSNAYSDDHIAMAVSQNNEIYLVCKTHPNSGSAAGIGLFKRSTSGNWQNFTVQRGGGWTRPAVVIDETNNELYVFGTQETSPEHGQYKKCALGNESSLQNAAVVEIFDDGSFNNISVPAHRVTGATDLLVCAETASGNAIWYNLLPISGGGALARAAEENPNTAEDKRDTASFDQADSPRVAAYPNPFNPSTTIRFTLRELAPVSLQIFNINGALVQTLIDGDLDAGIHERRWNGRDSFGRLVASGVYFYRLRMGMEVLNGRLEMVK